MSAPLDPDALAARLSEVYVVLGPLYRKAARTVERDEPLMGMSVGVRAVLDRLRRDGDATVPQIARDQDLSRQFVQRMVNDARAAGFVELASNPAHRRSPLVRLTSAGARAIESVAQREHRLMAQVGGDLTGDEVESTLRVLRHMLTALDEMEPTSRG